MGKSVVWWMLAVGLAGGVWARAPELTLDRLSLKFDGERKFLVSGEFHYFRVPPTEWRRRLELLKASGANCVATYIPWCVHEMTEGDIRFGDCPERDLDRFLKTVEEVGLMAMVRPGPYQYSELVYDGLPKWLVEGHPEIATRKKNGQPLRTGSVDYNHPVFLEKTRRYFKAVAKVLVPHLRKNGGCIALVQLDNETAGIHVWFGYPMSRPYLEDVARYLATLRGYLEAEGVTGPFCNNAGGTGMVGYLWPTAEKLGRKDFLIGYDNYYNLGDVWSRSHPDDRFLLMALEGCDVLKCMGYPPIGLEIQAGTIGDMVPILKNDLLACHMANLAAGARGINYYVFAGGPNFRGTGNTCDVYDYYAPVTAEGTLRPTYGAVSAFGQFAAAHPELLEAERMSSVQLAVEWPHLAGFGGLDENLFRKNVAHTLLLSPYAHETVLLDGKDPDPAKPVVLAGLNRMSARAQQKLVDFVRGGGALLAIPDFPRTDFEGKSCTILVDGLNVPANQPCTVDVLVETVTVSSGVRLFQSKPVRVFKKLPAGAAAVVTSEKGDRIYGASWPLGQGRVLQYGLTWTPKFFSEGEAFGRALARLGAVKTAESSMPAVPTTVWRLKDGTKRVFALNFHATPLETTVTLPEGKKLSFKLGPMEVQYR